MKNWKHTLRNLRWKSSLRVILQVQGKSILESGPAMKSLLTPLPAAGPQTRHLSHLPWVPRRKMEMLMLGSLEIHEDLTCCLTHSRWFHLLKACPSALSYWLCKGAVILASQGGALHWASTHLCIPALLHVKMEQLFHMARFASRSVTPEMNFS